MRRRTFTVLTALGGLAMIHTWALSSCSTDDRPLTLAIPYSLISICDPTAIAEIGRHYLVLVPEENDIGILENELVNGFTGSIPALSGYLRKQVSDEFKLGDIVEVNGWLLSRTEARQCALYMLLKS